MFWKKKKPKTQEEQDQEALQQAIFPGGEQEKLFRAKKVVEICNGKLLPKDALNIYAKAKARYKIAGWEFDGETHKGIDANKMIQRTIEDSILAGNQISWFESVVVNAYAVFDKIEPMTSSYETLNEALIASFGSDTQGYDCDVIPFAIGEFGFEATNPIPARGIVGIYTYLRRLHRQNEEKVVGKRVRAIREADQPTVDEYDAFSEGGEFLTKLYICGRHQRNSKKAPRGFKLIVPA